MLKQAHVYVSGDVIGVGFRAWTKIQARIHSVNGWIRNVFNKPDVFGPGGGVECVLQAEEDNLNGLLELLKKGPSVSRVDDIQITWQEPKEIIEGFEIKK